jgi:hypothetical protein
LLCVTAVLVVLGVTTTVPLQFVNVRKNILTHIHATGRVLMIFKGRNLAEPNEDEAFAKIAQKLRSMKKDILEKVRKATKPPPSSDEDDQGKGIETG